MKNKLSWGIALLPFVPSVWMQGQEQKQGIGNRRPNIIFIMSDRSEERRVGKECRSRWSPYH